jgi:predicted nucleic-acid-binding Zn-ribbon protein
VHKVKDCPECGGAHLYRSEEIRAGGDRGPNLLPGLGGMFTFARCNLVVCADCGFTRLFAAPKARAKLAESGDWTRV